MVALEASRPGPAAAAQGSWIRAIARIRNQNSGLAIAMIPRHSATAARLEATSRLSAENTIAMPSSASKPSTAQ